MAQKRVVITGMGLVSPVGNTVNESWENIKAGNSGIDWITLFDSDLVANRVAGEVKNLDLKLQQNNYWLYLIGFTFPHLRKPNWKESINFTRGFFHNCLLNSIYQAEIPLRFRGFLTFFINAQKLQSMLFSLPLRF